MNIITFVILAIIISTNIIPIILFGLLGAIVFWREDIEHYLTLYILLILFINLIFKISVLPGIWEIQTKYKTKSLSFWEKLENDKKYKIKLFVISAILDIIILVFNILIFKKLGFMTYFLFGSGFLLSYCSLSVWIKLSKSKFKTFAANIFKFFVFIGLLVFLFAGMIIFHSLKNRDIKISKYHEILKEIKTDTKTGDFSFFPQEIPTNATNYFFKKENSFDGYNTHYVKFDTDKAYIDNVLKKNKCEILTTKDKITDYDVNIYPPELKNADRICVLHKSTRYNKYTSGISIYDNTNTIYFFYANF